MLLGVAFVLWAGLFAWIASRDPDGRIPQDPQVSPASGMTLFDERCASCHGLDEMRAAAGSKDDPVRQTEILRFLEDHVGGSSNENRQILDFLTSRQRSLIVPAT